MSLGVAHDKRRQNSSLLSESASWLYVFRRCSHLLEEEDVDTLSDLLLGYMSLGVAHSPGGCLTLNISDSPTASWLYVFRRCSH